MNADFVIEESGYRGSTLKKYKGKDEVVTVPENVVCIDTKAFYNKKTLKKVILPASVKRIGTRAFGDCRQLEEINLGPGVEHIGRKAFSGCEKLGNADGLIVIDGCVYSCIYEDATRIKVTDGIHTIRPTAFFEQDTLENITLPAGLKSIGASAFHGCKNLKEIDVPDTVMTIDEYAFGSCKAMEKVELPKGLKEISENLFYYNTSLRQISIPKEVEIIGRCAFFRGDLLRDVYIESDRIEFAENAFWGAPEDVRVHCNRAVMKKLPKEIRSLCVLDMGTEDGLFYNRLNGLDVERMISDVSNKFTWEKPVYPKPCKASLEKGGKTLQVECKLATSLRSAKRKLEDKRVYDAYDAVSHMITEEESLALIDEMDPERTSDAFMFARAEVGPNATVLSEEEFKKRFSFLIYLAYKIADEKALKQIADEMPKKKNGTFAKNKILRLASSCLVIKGDEDDYILEIVAKPASDTDLTVSAAFRSMNEEEVLELEEDFVSTHPDIFNLGAYYTKENSESNNEDHQEASPEETEPAAPVDPKEQIRELMASPLDEDQQAKKDAWLADYGEDLDRDPQVEFENHVFVFTGIDDNKNSPLVKLIEDKGGVVRTKVSGKTNYLIVNPAYAGVSKVEDVLDYIEDGKEMKIILLEDLFPLL